MMVLTAEETREVDRLTIEENGAGLYKEDPKDEDPLNFQLSGAESGQIFVRRDDKMRIDFTKPDARTILRTGNDLFLYNPKANQVEQYDLGKHRSLVDQFLLLGFGTSGGDLEKSYLITLMGEENLDDRKTLKLELTPKSGDVRNQVSKIDIWVDESTWLPAQQQFFETGSGDYLLIRYSNISRNARISDNEFKQHWPKNVTRVKPQG